jgi:DNA-directed RNA polymerase specialized sigma24 family protein
MPSSALPFPWNDFLQFQSVGDNRSTCPASLGREEALTALVGAFGSDDEERDSENLRSQFDNLCCNRSAKHRRRTQLNERLAEVRRAERREGVRSLLSGRGPLSEDHVGMVITRELLNLARQCVPEADWQILWMLAEGYSYEETAACFGLTADNLRSRACRIRGRIRESQVGRLLHAALY